MTKAFDKIMAGALDALAHAEGDGQKRKVHVVEVADIKRIRAKTRLSQASFAKVFGIPVGTLRNWE